MGSDGLGKKLVFAAAAVGAILLVLRIVGGRDGREAGEEIDRVDTGRSDEESSGGPVETGLDRVGTDDEDAEAEAGADEVDADEESEADAGGDEVAVEATRGRFEGLDLFDYVAIAGAAFEAAREEYRNRI